MKDIKRVNEAEIGKRIGNIGDLPDSVRSQLEITQVDDLEQKVLSTLTQRFDGVATIDEVIVGLYRVFGYETKARQKVIDKLTKMTDSGLLKVHEDKKDVFEVTEAGRAIRTPLAEVPLSARM
jgi:septation ring formation regulator EzrA